MATEKILMTAGGFRALEDELRQLRQVERPEIIKAIGEDPGREGLRGTPRRVAEMYTEVFQGMDMDQAIRDSGLTPADVSNDDRSKLQTLERDLKNVVFGQDKALEVLSAAVKMARSGLGKNDKPIGAFLFTLQWLCH